MVSGEGLWGSGAAAQTSQPPPPSPAPPYEPTAATSGVLWPSNAGPQLTQAAHETIADVRVEPSSVGSYPRVIATAAASHQHEAPTTTTAGSASPESYVRPATAVRHTITKAATKSGSPPVLTAPYFDSSGRLRLRAASGCSGGQTGTSGSLSVRVTDYAAGRHSQSATSRVGHRHRVVSRNIGLTNRARVHVETAADVGNVERRIAQRRRALSPTTPLSVVAEAGGEGRGNVSTKQQIRLLREMISRAMRTGQLTERCHELWLHVLLPNYIEEGAMRRTSRSSDGRRDEWHHTLCQILLADRPRPGLVAAAIQVEASLQQMGAVSHALDVAEALNQLEESGFHATADADTLATARFQLVAESHDEGEEEDEHHHHHQSGYAALSALGYEHRRRSAPREAELAARRQALEVGRAWPPAGPPLPLRSLSGHLANGNAAPAAPLEAPLSDVPRAHRPRYLPRPELEPLPVCDAVKDPKTGAIIAELVRDFNEPGLLRQLLAQLERCRGTRPEWTQELVSQKLVAIRLLLNLACHEEARKAELELSAAAARASASPKVSSSASSAVSSDSNLPLSPGGASSDEEVLSDDGWSSVGGGGLWQRPRLISYDDSCDVVQPDPRLTRARRVEGGDRYRRLARALDRRAPYSERLFQGTTTSVSGCMNHSGRGVFKTFSKRKS